MPQQTFTSAYAAGMVRSEDVLAFHRATFGDARMGPDDPPRDEGEQNGEPASGSETPAGGEAAEEVSLDEVIKELGLTPGQIKGRLEAGKVWEQRAKASDRVARDDYDKVVAERDKLRQANETDHEKALREAKDAGASEAREQVFTETATAMLRMALRGHGITSDDDLDEIVAATNLAHFKGDDGAIDDQKVAALAKRMAGTAGAQQWPDMGQDKSGSSKRTGGMAAGSEAWEELHGKKPNTNS